MIFSQRVFNGFARSRSTELGFFLHCTSDIEYSLWAFIFSSYHFKWSLIVHMVVYTRKIRRKKSTSHFVDRDRKTIKNPLRENHARSLVLRLKSSLCIGGGRNWEGFFKKCEVDFFLFPKPDSSKDDLFSKPRTLSRKVWKKNFNVDLLSKEEQWVDAFKHHNHIRAGITYYSTAS